RGRYEDAELPNLILLDVNMPRLNGLQTLAAIKNDPVLRVIPVIMFSTASSPEQVRRNYEAYANCYVEKPANLERYVKFVQAVEAFWIELALPAPSDQHSVKRLEVVDSTRASSVIAESGLTIAELPGEMQSRTASIDEKAAIRTMTGRPRC